MREQFRDAQAAIRWACGLEGYPGRPLSARMLDRSRPESDWTDSAIQAGVIWHALRPLSGAPLAALVARAVPRTVPCACRRPCCSGHRPNQLWTEAVDILCAAALSAGIAPQRYDVRRAVIVRVYGKRRTNRELAADLSLDEHVIGRHARDIEVWLGARGREGLEPDAWTSAGRMLSDAGVLAGSPEPAAHESRLAAPA